MPNAGEPFNRGDAIQQRDGRLVVYEGALRSGNGVHVVNDYDGGGELELILDSDLENYRIKGGWDTSPQKGQTMLIKDEKYERGSIVEHTHGGRYTYGGHVDRDAIWGVTTPVGGGWHIITSDMGKSYLEPDRVFEKNYRADGGWAVPKKDEIWASSDFAIMVKIRLVVDDIVIFGPRNLTDDASVFTARPVDRFRELYRPFHED